MNQTNLLIIAAGLVSLMILIFTPKIEKNAPLWMKVGNTAFYILILMAIIALFRLIRDILNGF